MRLPVTFICCLFVAFAIAQRNTSYLLVGTYTSGKSEGIYVYKFNEDSGTATLASKVKTDNPSYLAVSHDKKFVYAVKEGGADNSSAALAYSFNAKTGNLHLLNKQPTKGNGPCYINVDSKNKWVFTANYKGGSLSAFPVKKDGSLDTVTQFIQHTGKSINKTRQQEAHAHTVVFSPDDKYLFSTDLGTDKINRYTFNAAATTTPLSWDADSVTFSTLGNGPRHIAFAPNKKFMYVINELSGTIDAFSYTDNKPARIQHISTDSTNNTTKGSADIHLSADGKFLYATNRGNFNTIATYRVNHISGTLQLLSVQPTGGVTPRNFTIDPSGKYLLIGHQKSDNITIFNRDINTGLLTLSNHSITIGSPVCLKMLTTD